MNGNEIPPLSGTKAEGKLSEQLAVGAAAGAVAVLATPLGAIGVFAGGILGAFLGMKWIVPKIMNRK